MYKIPKPVYKKLLKKFIHEQCGIIAGKVIGKDKYLLKIYDTKNSARKKYSFKISLWSKLKILPDMIKNGYFIFVPFHVHNKGLMMSVNDVKYAKLGSFNIVVCNGKMNLFKIVLTRKGKNCVPITYEVFKSE
jgi:hypothetical protein